MVQGSQPNGLSGCGVWYVRHIQEIFYPTGIIIEFIAESSLLVATKINVVLELLKVPMILIYHSPTSLE